MTAFQGTLLLLAAGLLCGFLFLLWRLVNQPLPKEKLEKLDRIESFSQALGELSSAVVGLQSQLGRDSAFQSNLNHVLQEVATQSSELARIRGERASDQRGFSTQLLELKEQLGSVHATLTGRKSGMAGENILREVLRHFPSEWVRSPYYDVEFGLVLFDRRVIPVDSKFAATELLERLGQTQDEEAKTQLAQQIERQVLLRAREVAKYIDPNATTTIAVCAVPDSVYQLLRRAHIQSYTDHKVVIMPYSMAVPYLLSLYDLHLRFVGQIDEARLEAFIASVEQAVKTLKDTLENKIREANTRLSNAYRDCVQAVGTIEGSLAALKSSRVQSVEQEATR